MPLNPNTRFRDPAAEVVWAALCVLDEGAQHVVLDELLERLATPEERPSPHQIRLSRAVAALREASKLLGGRSPSVSDYRRLRDQHPERRWPADGSVRDNLGGSWGDALAAARLDPLGEPRQEPPPRGPDLATDEILAAIRECASDLDKPIHELSFSEYVRWARKPRVRRRAGRRPASQQPFDRLGGWRDAKRKAMGGDPEAAEQLIVAAGADGHGYRYTDDEIFAAADEIIARLEDGRPWPTAARWNTERRTILAEERSAEKPPRAIPGSGVLLNRFDSWPGARFAYERARDEGLRT